MQRNTNLGEIIRECKYTQKIGNVEIKTCGSRYCQVMTRQRTIRHARQDDLREMLTMIAHSRQLMRAAGNTVQWTQGYPGEEELLNDIARRNSYIIEEGGQAIGTFALVHGIEPTYGRIDDGLWLDDTTPYATVHRLACREGVEGIGDSCLKFCQQHTAESLRADTHERNAAMRHLLEKHGYTRCGTVYMDDGTPRVAYQKMLYPMVQTALRQYVETSILPQYDHFDAAHRRDHALRVMAQSMELAKHYPEIDKEMAYTIAAYHDLGLCEGRERHHIVSGRIVRDDSALREWFSPTDIEVMAQAVENHRASAQGEPRSRYGMIVAEADRNIEPLSIVRRTVQYGLSHHPELDREGHWQRTLQHLEEKYAPGGYLRLYIPESRNALQMQRLHALIADRERLRQVFEETMAAEGRMPHNGEAHGMPQKGE